MMKFRAVLAERERLRMAKYPSSPLAADVSMTPTQNMNLSAACISRGGAAFTTWPNKVFVTPPSTADGPKNCTWLNTLNVSSLNCNSLVSVNARSFPARDRC